MNVGLTQEDIDLVRSYVTAKDGHEYDYLQEGIVSFDITHNYLKVRIHSVRMPLNATIHELKQKIVTHSGTPVEFQQLELQTAQGAKIRDLWNDQATLQSCGFANGMTVHCVDTNPNSLAKDGGLDDISKVKKYVMSDEEYSKRKGTVREYKLQNKAIQISENHTADTVYTAESVSSIHIGDRCEVSPGGRRGTVRWVGELEHGDAAMGGFWVGIALDEPTGRNNGSYKDKQLFECLQNYGIFVRAPNVQVGDYPEDDFDMDEEF